MYTTKTLTSLFLDCKCYEYEQHCAVTHHGQDWTDPLLISFGHYLVKEFMTAFNNFICYFYKGQTTIIKVVTQMFSYYMNFWSSRNIKLHR